MVQVPVVFDPVVAVPATDIETLLPLTEAASEIDQDLSVPGAVARLTRPFRNVGTCAPVGGSQSTPTGVRAVLNASPDWSRAAQRSALADGEAFVPIASIDSPSVSGCQMTLQ